MIAVYTGNGKGKTTACIGVMTRAVGRGKKAIMIQFIKGPWISGEHKFLDDFVNLSGRMKIYRGGLGFVRILGDKISFEKHKKAAEKTLLKAKGAIMSKKWDIIVLDEINVAVSLKLIRARDVINVLRFAPKNKLIILSGRNAPKSFIKIADLVSEIKDIKHPYNRGKKALIGFDF